MSGPSVYSTPGKEAYYDYDGGHRRNVLWNYKLSPALTFSQNYVENAYTYHNRYLSSKKTKELKDYSLNSNRFNLQLDDNDWKGHIAYGIQEKQYDKTSKSKKTHKWTKAISSWRKGKTLDVDLQKKFELGKGSLLLGGTFAREKMDTFARKSSKGHRAGDMDNNFRRNVYSVYASYDLPVGEDGNLYFNARETWTGDSQGIQYNRKTKKTTVVKNDSQSKFTPEIEYVHHLRDNRSLYAKAGTSFRLPNLTQIYGNGTIKPKYNLNPEKGTHYEVGYKAEFDKASWRVAAYHFDVKDSIEAKPDYNKQEEVVGITYENSDVRNTGIEISANFTHDENWSTSLGLMFNNPEVRNEANYGDNEWHEYFGKYQLTAGVNYKLDKFTASLNGNYVGDRTSTRFNLSKPERHLKSQFFTDLHLTYEPEKIQRIFVHVNNLLDRRDITSNSTSNFYTLDRNFVVGYEYDF